MVQRIILAYVKKYLKETIVDRQQTFLHYGSVANLFSLAFICVIRRQRKIWLPQIALIFAEQ